MPTRLTALIALALPIALSAQQQAGKATTTASNTLTAAEAKAGWKLLFDGSSTTGWRGYKSQSVPPEWHVEDGTLTKSKPAKDLVTTDKYANFELQVDWKLAPKGNAGIFYRGTEEYEAIYWSAPEYQLLDDKGHPDGKSRLTAAASDYALYPSPAGHVHRGGSWNHTRLVVNGNHVEHWLNGHKMVTYTLGSKDWTARVKKSKFNDYPNYGKASEGYIGIQGDHDGALWLRNIKIKVLP
jgi:3-keto-disaccharide hydrolase